jgi:hypothetical protein
VEAKVTAPNTVQLFREKDGGYGLLMEVKDARKEKTGWHGALSLYGIVPHRKEPILLAGSEDNIKRDPVRTRLLNAARLAAGDMADAIMGPIEEKAFVKQTLDLFCMEMVEKTLMAVDAPGMVEGDSMIPLEFLAEPHILKNAGTILFGDHGHGKSLVSMVQLVCVDAGLNGLWGVEQAPGMYVNLERSAESMKRRLGQVNDALGLETSRPLAILNARGRTLLAARPQIEQMIRERDIKLLVLDSITRADIGDLNDAGPANQTMDILSSLVSSWVAIGHVGHADKSRIIGSRMFAAAADIMLQLTSEKKTLPDASSELGIMLKVTKANDIEWPKPMTLTLTFGANNIGLQDIKPADTNEWPGLEAKADSERSLRARLYNLLTANGEMIVQEMAVALNEADNKIRARLSENEGKDFLLLNPGEGVQRWGALRRE